MPGITVGGQAVLEGVMIRAPGVMSVAVRRLDGTIALQNNSLNCNSMSCFNLPMIRGGVALIQSLILGFQALDYSSLIAFHGGQSRSDNPESNSMKSDIETQPIASLVSLAIFGSVFFLAIALLLLMPWYITENIVFLNTFVLKNPFAGSLLEGMIRASLIITYIVAISLIPEIRRVFQYHGAEHMAIHTYEAGQEMTVENAKCYSRFHPRCGTALLFTMMIVSVVLFSLIPPVFSFWLRALLRIILVPVVAGGSYEIIRIIANSNNRFFRSLLNGALWLQYITTREPSLDQLEVSIVALRSALENSRDDHFAIIV